MINSTTPFLNRDGTVAREWLLFFLTLDKAVGGTNTINPTSITDVQTLEELVDAVDLSDQVPQLLGQVAELRTLQEVGDATDLSNQVPGLLRQTLATNVLLWLDTGT